MNKISQWVVTVAFSGIGVKFMDYIPWEKVVNEENWSWLLKDRFNWLQIIVFLILAGCVWFLVNCFTRHKKNPIEEKLKQFNELVDDDKNIKVTWDMFMGSLYDNDPHPYNIKIFCLNHGDIPQLMEHGCCRFHNCKNNIYPGIDEKAVKSEIESRLLHYRDQLVKK